MTEVLTTNPNEGLLADESTFTFAKLIEFVNRTNTGITLIEAAMLMLSLSFGSAVVIMPYNFLLLGPITCILFTLALVSVLAYCTKLTYYSCQAVLEKRSSLEHVREMYPLLAEVAVGPAFGKLLSCMLYTYSAAATTAFFLLAATICADLWPIDHLSTYGNLRSWTTICFCFMLPVMCMGNYNDLANTALIGVIMSAISLLAIIIDSFIAKGYKVESHDSFLEEHRVQFQNIFKSFGMICFAIGGPAFALPNMYVFVKEQNKLPSVISRSHISIFILYVIAGFIPFVIFNKKVKPSITTTLELYYRTEYNHVSFKVLLIISQICMVLHLLIAGVICVNPLFLAVEKRLKIPLEVNWKRICVRIIGNLVLLGICLAFPNFQNVLSIVGGVPIASVVVIFPILIYARLYDLSRKEIVLQAIILFCCVFLLIGNFIVEVKQLMLVIQQKQNVS